MKEPLFEETQRSLVLVVLPIIFAIAFGAMAVIQIVFHKPIGNHPAPSFVHVIIAVISVAAAVLLSKQELKLTITTDEIQYSLGVFTSPSTIQISNIKTISIRRYNALKEFLGWGVRYNSTTDCFTVSGDKGLEIVLLNSNKKILIGTERQADLQLVLQTHFQDKFAQPSTTV